MPVEYSGAAYRFGHSMIRAEYEVQDGHTVPIFGQDGYEDLRGNRQIPASLWIDWNYFFEIPGMNTPDDRNMARLIDTQLSLPLFKLPSTVVAPTAGAIVALAERNLLRGKRLGLPAGQDVATAMGIKPLTNAQLGLTEPGWKNKAPLWFYILKESELLGGKKLGPVGGRIVAEVILGLLGLDKTSYFNANPSFVPGPNYKMGDFILAADAIDPRARIETPEEPEDPNAPEEPEEPGAAGGRRARGRAPRGGGAGGRGGGRGPGPAGACRAGQPGGHLTGRVRIPDRAGLTEGLAHTCGAWHTGLHPVCQASSSARARGRLHERGGGPDSGRQTPAFGASPRSHSFVTSFRKRRSGSGTTGNGTSGRPRAVPVRAAAVRRPEGDPWLVERSVPAGRPRYASSSHSPSWAYSQCSCLWLPRLRPGTRCSSPPPPSVRTTAATGGTTAGIVTATATAGTADTITTTTTPTTARPPRPPRPARRTMTQPATRTTHASTTRA